MQMYASANHWRLFACHFDSRDPQSCTLGLSDFQQTFVNLSVLTLSILTVLPALVGVFVGAPLVAREVEHRTHILAWTQGITRLRWFGVKSALLTAAMLAAGSVLAALATWWHRPMDLAFTTEGSWHFFSVVGMTPVAYTIFALALGLAAGTLVRRTIPAMALTLLVFAAARALVQYLRPMFAAPLRADLDYANPSYPRDALLINVGWVDTSGHPVSYDRVNNLIESQFPGAVSSSGPAPQSPADAAAISQYLHNQGLHYLAVYQPADRFWSFQAIETAVFVGLALALVALAAWWLGHEVR
jgi:hypothetical protein